MSNKSYTINEEKTGKSYKLTISYNASSLGFKVQSTTNSSEVYEIKGITLKELQNKNKVYKQFDSISKIADVISKKIENKNFIFRANQAVLKLKHTNEYDDEEYISYELSGAAAGGSGGSSGSSSATLSQLKEENAKLRKENADLKSKLQSLQQKKPGAPASIFPSNKPVLSTNITAPTYSGSSKSSNTYSVPNTNTTKNNSSQPISDNPLLDKTLVKSTQKTQAYSTPWDQPVYHEQIKSGPKYSKIDSVYEIPYLNYPPAYKSGDFFHRFNICVNNKTNLKKTLDNITKRYDELMVPLTRDMDRIFAGSPTKEQKMKMLDLINKMLCVYHESRDIEHYDDMFKKEVEQKKMTFSGKDKEKYEDGMAILSKGFPYQITLSYTKINDNFRKIINKFFIEKNLRFYKPDEINDVNDYKQRLMFKTN